MKQVLVAGAGIILLLLFTPIDAVAYIENQQAELLGGHYAKMSMGERIPYVTGVVHGMTLARPIDESDDMVPWLHDCVDQMKPSQLDVIVAEYISQHPELNGARLDVLTFLSFQKTCRKRR